MSKDEKAVNYLHTQSINELLAKENISLLATTYQAQRLLAFSPGKERLNMLMRVFPRPTGLAVSETRWALAARYQIIVFERVYDVKDANNNPQQHDACFSPRLSYYCGDIQGHEITWLNDIPHIINTRFNCICIPSNRVSFESLWKPKFISELVPEDRCHLNGMATENNSIKYLTCLAKTNVKDAWRNHKRDGGIIIRYPDSEVISSGLSMPHSPRLYAGKLWVLNSGRGLLEIVDEKSGVRSTVARFPGFLRGLSFYKKYAFVGLSLIRESNTFGGLEIQEQASELECAIYCLDIEKGSVVGFIKFTKGIEELFDIQILNNCNNPEIIGFEGNDIDSLIVPG